MTTDNPTETIPMPSKFHLGQLVATPGALQALHESGQTPDFFLARHAAGDWGEVCEEDGALNDQALKDGSRILSAYSTLKGKRLWIITGAADEDGNRTVTTILRPEEYQQQAPQQENASCQQRRRS